jgi:hypothetical protein
MIPVARKLSILLMVALLMVSGIAAAPATIAVPSYSANLAMQATQETISFPARSADLPSDAYWAVREFGEGCCTLDLNVVRWSDGSWSDRTGSSANDQDYTWNVPIYAPANGVIASCWRNFPDDPSPGANPSNNNISAAGNNIVIITDQGNAIVLAHFRAGTISAELCPTNADTTQYPATMTKEGDWRVAAYINPANRPRVTEGDYIGRAGNSGNTSGPHLHMSLTEITGTDAWGREARAANSSPMRFRHGWGHRYEQSQQDAPAGWSRLLGGNFIGDPACASYQANSPACGFKMVHPSPYLRRG